MGGGIRASHVNVLINHKEGGRGKKALQARQRLPSVVVGEGEERECRQEGGREKQTKTHIHTHTDRHN
jgi:hypothetical protein